MFRLGPLWWLLVIGCGVSLAIVIFGPMRLGGYILAGVFVVTELGRMSLPDKLVGGVAVRSRAIDACTLLALAIAIVVSFAKIKLDGG